MEMRLNKTDETVAALTRIMATVEGREDTRSTASGSLMAGSVRRVTNPYSAPEVPVVKRKDIIWSSVSQRSKRERRQRLQQSNSRNHITSNAKSSVSVKNKEHKAGLDFEENDYGQSNLLESHR